MSQDHDKELRELWTGQCAVGQTKGEDMLAIVERKSMQFDRVIWRRNLSECVASVFIIGFFGWLGFRQPNLLGQLGCWWTAASGAWIMFYILTYGRQPPQPQPDQTLRGYREQLRRKYDHQLRLLRNVKYWYLLPPYLGLMMIGAGQISQAAQGRPVQVRDVLNLGIFTAAYGFVWWLNEGPGVRSLERAKRALDESES